MKKNFKQKIICGALIVAIILGTYGCGAVNKKESIAADGTGGSTTTTAGTAAYDGGDEEADISYSAGDDELYEFDAARSAERYDTKSPALSMEKSASTTTTATTAAVVAEAGADAVIGTTDVISSDEDEPEKDLPEFGQLTAGQWNDNENWGFFSNLVNTGTISYPCYEINPTSRVAVSVKNNEGSPVANAKAELIGKSGGVIWSGVTNKDGVVYLFNQVEEGVSVNVSADGKSQSFAVPQSTSNEQTTSVKSKSVEMEVTLDTKAKTFKDMDIMFIVDTTGSMSDEILFLQSEFTAITEKIGTENTRYSVNFYRDEGDDYVTKCNPFSSKVKDIQEKLNKEDADCGGDYPEAVAEILTETMFKADWKEDSVKVAFMIFDAPPHDDKGEELNAAIQEAAKKGIHIVPVISSDSDRSTELFGRAMAIMTDGEYVFLTDDSGIGNSHSEPIIGHYDVRPLYDIIIDIINNYRQ